MDLVTFETFLKSQETTLGAVLEAGTTIESNEVRKAFERHQARANRIVRNALPPVPNPADEVGPIPTPSRSRSGKSTPKKPKTTPSSERSSANAGAFEDATEASSTLWWCVPNVRFW